MLAYHLAPVNAMHILHVVHQYPPEYVGGTEFYTQWLARALQTRGHTTAVFHRGASGDGSLRLRREDGIPIWTAGDGDMEANRRFRATFGSRPLQRAFAHLLTEELPDLVHIQHLMGLPARLVRQLHSRNIPYVVTLHDYWYGCANAQLITNYDGTICDGPDWWINCGRCALARAGLPGVAPLAAGVAPLLAMRHHLLKHVMAGAAAIISPSEFVREMYTQLGLPVANLTVVPHGIELPDAAAKAALAQTRPDAAPLRIAYIGGIAWQKGVHVLVEAVNRLPHDAARLVIYGDTTAFPAYADTLSKTMTHPHIALGGRLARADLWTALAQTDVVVVPSLWYETSSLIVQEAFAAGVPVLAANIGAIPEKVVDGVNGRLLPPGDVDALHTALRALIQHPAQLAALRAGITPVRSMAEHVAEVEAIYRRVAPSSRHVRKTHGYAE